MFAPIFPVCRARAWASGVRKFWRDVSPGTASAPAVSRGHKQRIASLKYLDGGHGDGCNESRRRLHVGAAASFHHLTFYGFMLCFAATSVATIYHYVFNWQAPYAFTSLPVLLGTVGGIGLLDRPRRFALA